MNTIRITRTDRWALSMVVIPGESPVGIIDRATYQLIHRGRTFHALDSDQEEWLDTATGEIVRVAWPPDNPHFITK